MSSRQPNKDNSPDHAAWLAVAQALRDGKTPAEPSDQELADWLDGGQDEATSASVDAWIARNPVAASERIESLREAMATTPPKVPARLLLRLRAMRPRSVGSSEHSRPAWRAFPQAAGLAAALALGTFGAYHTYEAGLHGALAAEQAESLVAQAALGDLATLDDDLPF